VEEKNNKHGGTVCQIDSQINTEKKREDRGAQVERTGHEHFQIATGACPWLKNTNKQPSERTSQNAPSGHLRPKEQKGGERAVANRRIKRTRIPITYWSFTSSENKKELKRRELRKT